MKVLNETFVKLFIIFCLIIRMTQDLNQYWICVKILLTFFNGNLTIFLSFQLFKGDRKSNLLEILFLLIE